MTFEAIFRELQESHVALCSDDSPGFALRERVLALRSRLTIASRAVLQSSAAILKPLDHRTRAAYCELRVALLVSLGNEEEQTNIYKSIEQEISLTLQQGGEAAQEVASAFVSCLIIALDDLPASLASRILHLLGSLTGRQEGIDIPLEKSDLFGNLESETASRLSQLLDVGLASEVFSFLELVEDIPSMALRSTAAGDSMVVPVTSRKGGVGKSTILMSILFWFLETTREGDACILDLDVTGPVWQYLLSPKGGKSIPYLNALIDIEQSDKSFVFGKPDHQAVLSRVAPIRVPVIERHVGLITLADWPRTNRHLVQAIANNRASFAEFLESIIGALATRYKLILIDSSPGFDAQSLLTLVLASRLKGGVPIVVGTPFLPDLRGVILELSDLRLLHLKRRPIWCVNKAGKEVMEFFAKPHSLIEIAQEIRVYSEMLPEPPVLIKLLRQFKLDMNAVCLPFDSSILGLGDLKASDFFTEHGIGTFLASGLYKHFKGAISNDGSALSVLNLFARGIL